MNGVSTNYTLDLNSGLTQVLTDGTNTYTYGLGRISQEQSGNDPEYFLGDALGSVRQLTSPSGQVTYAKSYDPYGTVTQASGATQSASGFTGEMQDAASGMVYLRSRYYNVADGRFQSRDTWGGNANRPMSMNRWGYAEGNPINLTDPTGNEPLSTGYMEGYSEGGGIGEGFIEGEEIVYDYATMTRARFTYAGKVGSILLSSVGWTIYVGPIIGFGYEPDNVQSIQIKNDYSGSSTGGYIGGGVKGLPRAVGVSVGAGYFRSQTSNVKGIFTYFSAGASLEPFEVVGFESNYSIDPQSLPGDNDSGVEFYADASGNVNRGKLISDILTGDHSPIGHLSGIVLSNVGQERISQIGTALVAAFEFEEFHHKYNFYNICPDPYWPPAPTPFPDPLKIPSFPVFP